MLSWRRLLCVCLCFLFRYCWQWLLPIQFVILQYRQRAFFSSMMIGWGKKVKEFSALLTVQLKLLRHTNFTANFQQNNFLFESNKYLREVENKVQRKVQKTFFLQISSFLQDNNLALCSFCRWIFQALEFCPICSSLFIAKAILVNWMDCFVCASLDGRQSGEMYEKTK